MVAEGSVGQVRGLGGEFEHIRRLAAEQKAERVFIFGSSVRRYGAHPRDLDVAIILPGEDVPYSLVQRLAVAFPGCRIDRAMGYRRWTDCESGDSPFHFVLASRGDRLAAAALIRGIFQGAELWRRKV